MSYGRMMVFMRGKRGQDGGMESRRAEYAQERRGSPRMGYQSNYNEGPRSSNYGGMGSSARSMGNTYDGIGGGDPEMAFRDRRGRKHYDNGRYAPMRSAYNGGEEEEDMPMGFDMTGRLEQPGREMGRAAVYENGSGGWDVRGSIAGKSGGSDRMTKEMADTWTSRMHNEDGSTGPHWTMTQIQQLQQQKKELQDYDLPELFAVMNMMYSDYCKVAKKFNANTVDFYVALASAWLDDKDAGEGKTARYYEHVVR